MQYQIGDKLRRPGFPYHDGIYVGPSSLYGEDVVHGDKASGVVRLAHFSEFAAGQRVELVSRARSWQEGCAIRQRALSRVGTRYDLLNFNCEHLANYAQTGVSFSPLVAGAVAAGMVGLALWVASQS